MFFFVISGFVVTPLILKIFAENATRRDRLSHLKLFYTGRFYRLAPALSVTLAISAIIVFLLGYIADHQRFARHGIGTLLLIGNISASKYAGDYFSPDPNPLIHTWSLSVEGQIYIFLPLIILVALMNRRYLKKNASVVLVTTTIISFITFQFPAMLQPLYSQAGIDLADEFWFYSSISRIWQFTIGGLGFLLINQIQTQILKIRKEFKIFSVIAMMIILFVPININLKAGSIVASLVALILIVTKSLDVLPIFIIQKFEWLGNRSYSIYLVHMPLLYIAKYSPATKIGNFENRIIQSIIAVVAALLLGSLSYQNIEKKVRYMNKNKYMNFKKSSPFLITILASPLILFILLDIGVRNQYWGLSRDISPSYAGALDSNCSRESEKGPPCVYSNEGSSKTVLLLGDSHAGHISQAVIDAAKISNWNTVVWAHGGCHVQFQRTINGHAKDQCININKTMKNWVLVNKPEAIIVSQYVYSNSSQSDLREALSTLKSMVPNILLIENNPAFPDGLSKRNKTMIELLVKDLAGKPYNPPKSFSLSEMQIEHENASNQLAI